MSGCTVVLNTLVFSAWVTVAARANILTWRICSRGTLFASYIPCAFTSSASVFPSSTNAALFAGSTPDIIKCSWRTKPTHRVVCFRTSSVNFVTSFAYSTVIAWDQAIRWICAVLIGQTRVLLCFEILEIKEKKSVQRNNWQAILVDLLFLQL